MRLFELSIFYLELCKTLYFRLIILNWRVSVIHSIFHSLHILQCLSFWEHHYWYFFFPEEIEHSLYTPAETEQFVMKNLDRLGFNETNSYKSKGCSLFSPKSKEENLILSNPYKKFYFSPNSIWACAKHNGENQRCCWRRNPKYFQINPTQKEWFYSKCFPNSQLSYSSSMGDTH